VQHECPLRVKSRHCVDQSPRPLYPQKADIADATGMSALCQKQTTRVIIIRVGGSQGLRGGRSQAVRRVLHGSSVGRVDTQPVRGGEIHVRRRLARGHLFTRDDDGEAVPRSNGSR
jgi:hypothetical protein